MGQFALVLAGFAVVIVTALLAAGRLGQLPEAEADNAAIELPGHGMSVEHLRSLRLGIGFRGYRMDEVDVVLDRVTVALEERDARIAELEGRIDLRESTMRAAEPRNDTQDAV